MSQSNPHIEHELIRLRSGSPDPVSLSAGLADVAFTVYAPGRAASVLTLAKRVLSIVDEALLTGQPVDLAGWTARLPPDFVTSCALPMTKQQSEDWLARWRTMSADEQSKAEFEMRWALEDWLYWIESGQRQWYWVTGELISEDEIVLHAQVHDWPFPWGSLRWLFIASGASRVDPIAGEV